MLNLMFSFINMVPIHHAPVYNCCHLRKGNEVLLILLTILKYILFYHDSFGAVS